MAPSGSSHVLRGWCTRQKEDYLSSASLLELHDQIAAAVPGPPSLISESVSQAFIMD